MSTQVSTNVFERFDSLNLDPMILRGVSDMGFTTPTPIQAQAIPPLLEGRDVLGAAATGSGKTAAFSLPILNTLMSKPRGMTRVLILAPTRELAAQITDHINQLARHTKIRAMAVFGGVGMRPQENAFRRGVDIIVATPGRLLDHLQYPYARLNNIEFLVIDEADRMLDMGFLPDVKRVLARVPAQRQSMLFSATMPAPIVVLSRELLKDPVSLNIERKSAPAKGIDHGAFPVPADLKTSLLYELLTRGDHASVLVFTRTKHRANRLADFLVKKGIAANRIHGNLGQTRRIEALEGFKTGKHRVLVATDIAARGIDVEELALVVNFDVPHLPEDYIHRVGRTARASATGDAITLVSPGEESDMRSIERHIGQRIRRLKMDGFDYRTRPQEQLEIPIAERIAEIRRRKADERERARAKAEKKATNTRPDGSGQIKAVTGGRPNSGERPGNGGRPTHGGYQVNGERPGNGGRPTHGGYQVNGERPGNSGRPNNGGYQGNSERPGNGGRSNGNPGADRSQQRKRPRSFTRSGDRV